MHISRVREFYYIFILKSGEAAEIKYCGENISNREAY